MSASPQPPGSGNTPNGGPTILRRPRTADPLVRKKPRRPQPAPQTQKKLVNGKGPTKQTPPVSNSLVASRTIAPEKTEPKDSRGFSTYAGENCEYYELVTTKKALLDGLRHHVARFASNKNVDPRDQQEFLRPVRLQRRDPRAPPSGAGAFRDDDVDMEDGGSKSDLVDIREREKQEQIKAERDAQRQADLAQIAPNASVNRNAPRKPNPSKKKTQQGRRTFNTPEEKARQQLRYEEALPWHLEDFENKNTWVGNYESALSDTYCMLGLERASHFQFVPLERWYRFTPKNQFKTMTIEEAEAAMSKKVAQPRWQMDFERKVEEQKAVEATKQASSKLYVGSSTAKHTGPIKSEAVDADELDFEEDRFADDEENPVLELNEEEQEETKQAAERIKRDQLQANIFDLNDEKEVDAEAEATKKEEERKQKDGKKVKKALKKREKNFLYASDSDNDPYGIKSESEDSDDSAAAAKKDEEKKADKTKGKDAEKLPSGASSRGNNTPSGRNKTIDHTKRATSGAPSKRPGSPNLSDASGTESARKKQKKKHPPSSSQPLSSGPNSGTTSAPSSSAPEVGRPGLGPRPSSLNEVSAHSSRPDIRRSRTGAGSGSDGEATGGDGSDGGNSLRRKKKMKIRGPGSPTNGSPVGSRAGSPQPHAGAASRVASPGENRPVMTAADVINAIPPEGISTADAMAKLKPLGFLKDLFVRVVKEKCTMEERNGKKLVFLRPGVTGNAP